MQRLIHILALVLISACSFAQTFNWQEMNKPYFVSDAKGISVGWDGNTQYSYLLASNLTSTLAYRTTVNGAESWEINGIPEPRVPRPGATRVCASRSSGGYAAAIVPIGDPSNPNPEVGVHFTIDGGQSWTYNPNSQPPIQNLLCVAVSPTNPNMAFVGGLRNQGDNAYTLWRTTDRGATWSDIWDLQTQEPVHSLRFYDHEGTMRPWACYGYYGLWYYLSSSGWWPVETSPYPDPNHAYEAFDFAVAGIGSNHNYLLGQQVGLYTTKLWYTEDFINWAEIKDFGSEDPFEIIATSQSVGSGLVDTVWTISDTTLKLLTVEDGELIGETTFRAKGNPYTWIDYTPATAGQPYPEIYISRKYSFEKLVYNTHYQAWMNEYRVDGTNEASGFQLSEGIGIGTEGRGLYCFSNTAGYVFRNAKILDSYYPNEWEFAGYTVPSPTTAVINGDVCAYYEGNSTKFIAVGYDNSNHVGAFNDIGPVNLVAPPYGPITSLGACVGKRSMYGTLPSFEYIGGTYIWGPTARNKLWNVAPNNTGYSFYDEFTPRFKDLILLEDNSRQAYLPLGAGDNNTWSSYPIVKYFFSQDHAIDLVTGLTNVDCVNSICESNEQAAPGTITLYAAAHDGTNSLGKIYKNNYDFSITGTPWYPVFEDMPSGSNMLSVVTTKHLGDCGQFIDQLIVYALGQNASGQPYLYVSPDNGSNWLEFGQGLRNVGAQVNNLEIIESNGAANGYFIVASGASGMYRYPLNVMSGVISSTTTWGPGLVIVNGDITIPTGVTLTIAAGTTVKFVYGFDRLASGNDVNKSEMLVYGTLNLDGEDNNHVVLTSSKATPSYGDWYGIWVMNNGSLEMKHTDLDYAVTAVTAEQGSNTNIRYSQGDVPKIGHTRNS